MARAGRKRSGESTRTAGPRGETRAAIIEATVETLAELGFSGTSARAVADRAGVAPGGVFYHFGSMDQLLAEVYTTCLDRRIARLRAAVAVPVEGLSAAFTDAVRNEFAHIESRALLELVVGAINSPELAVRVRAGFDTSFAFTREVIEQVLADSPLAGALPLDLIAQVAASAFFGLAVLDLVGAEVDIEGMTAMANLLIGIAAGRMPELPEGLISPAGPGAGPD
jgi:AcrR family transcriptional regulator